MSDLEQFRLERDEAEADAWYWRQRADVAGQLNAAEGAALVEERRQFNERIAGVEAQLAEGATRTTYYGHTLVPSLTLRLSMARADAAEAQVALLTQAIHEKNDAGAAAVRAIGELEATIALLTEAIRWALGEVDEFPERQDGQGPYWWRAELRRRAALAAARGEG